MKIYYTAKFDEEIPHEAIIYVDYLSVSKNGRDYSIDLTADHDWEIEGREVSGRTKVYDTYCIIYDAETEKEFECPFTEEQLEELLKDAVFEEMGFEVDTENGLEHKRVFKDAEEDFADMPSECTLDVLAGSSRFKASLRKAFTVMPKEVPDEKE